MTHDEDMSLERAQLENVSGYVYALKMQQQVNDLRSSLQYLIGGCTLMACSLFTLAWWVFSR